MNNNELDTMRVIAAWVCVTACVITITLAIALSGSRGMNCNNPEGPVLVEVQRDYKGNITSRDYTCAPGAPTLEKTSEGAAR